MRHNDVNSDVVDRVYSLIMATVHDAEPKRSDEALLVDIDLAILGSKPSTFWKFEADVRAEYKWVRTAIFKQRRRQILLSFLSRERIFHTTYFYENYEGQARENIAWAVARLGSG